MYVLWVVISMIIMIPNYHSFGNVPGGGTGTGPNVTVTDNGTSVTLNNGIVYITVSKTSGTITDFHYLNTNLFLGGQFYWSWNMPNYQNPSGTYTLSVDPGTNGGNYAEIHIHAPWTGDTATAAMDVDVYYSLTRGAQGFYATGMLNHPATYPDNPGGEWRSNGYVSSIFNWLSVDSLRNHVMPSPTDTSIPVTGAPKEVIQYTSGVEIGNYFCKYSYSADLGSLNTWGWTSGSKHLGIWMTVPSHEYYNGGPMKRELTGHQGNTLLNMLDGQHYGMGNASDMPAGSTMQKTFGPFFIYANSYAGPATDPEATVANTLWADAQAQAAAEQSAWPYTWFNNTNYVQQSGRGTVTGTLKVTDTGNPNASAANAWIGLAPNNNGTDFQFQSWTYQYWVKTDANGNFTIPHVIAGNYNLWAFGAKNIGTFEQANVTVTAGQTTTLGNVNWQISRIQPTVWEIGIPDRDSHEFNDGLYNYTQWQNYINISNMSPNGGPNYTVGTSDWTKDWNYGQIGPITNTINFNLAQAPKTGVQSSLYLALASSYSTHINITVNGTQIASFVPGNGSDALVRLGSHGAFWDTRFPIAAGLLKAGTNTIVINQLKGTVEYDYIRLEASLPLPPAPTVTSLISYCQNATPTALTATAVSGATLNWYANASGGTASATAPIPSTSNVGTTTYYVSQSLGGLESQRASIVVTVNALPVAPTVISPVTYCQGTTAVALSATGTGLKWYVVATGGTSSSTAPTPSTTSAGNTNYYVSQTTNGCESPRATITVTVNAIPNAPAVTSPLTYCQGSTATALNATGTGLKWYTVVTGGISSATAPTPSTANTGSVNYYVSQTTNGCESPRATITVTVNTIPNAPAVTSPLSYCQGAIATALNATGTGLKWYTVVTGGTSSTTAPAPSTANTGSVNYYVSQTINSCESSRSTITVTVNALPSAPTVTSPLAYCQNAMATALSASGKSLSWYTTATGGTASTIAPVPNTSAIGTVNYFVSQTSGTCESSRATISVTVNALPVPVITSSSGMPMCTGSSSVLSTGTASTYNWLNGTSQVGTSQTYTVTTAGSYTVTVTNGSGCRGTSTVQVVTISAQNCYDCANVLNGSATIDNCGVCTGGTTGLIPCTTTGTISSISGTSILVYPQPFENTTKVELKNGGDIESITIYSSTGSLVYTNNDINGAGIEVGESLADGLYNVIIQTKESTYNTKIIKMK